MTWSRRRLFPITDGLQQAPGLGERALGCFLIARRAGAQAVQLQELRHDPDARRVGIRRWAEQYEQAVHREGADGVQLEADQAGRRLQLRLNVRFSAAHEQLADTGDDAAHLFDQSEEVVTAEHWWGN